MKCFFLHGNDSTSRYPLSDSIDRVSNGRLATPRQPCHPAISTFWHCSSFTRISWSQNTLFSSFFTRRTSTAKISYQFQSLHASRNFLKNSNSHCCQNMPHVHLVLNLSGDRKSTNCVIDGTEVAFLIVSCSLHRFQATVYERTTINRKRTLNRGLVYT
jgi:hypothetical protein